MTMTISAKNTWRRVIGGGGSGESAWSVQDPREFGPVLAQSDLFQNILIVSASPDDDAAYVATRKGQPATEEAAALPPSVFMGIGGLRLTLEKSDGVFSLVLSYGDGIAPFALHQDRDSGRVSFCPNVPEYANDAAADADALLKPGAFYKLTGGRQIFQKPW